MCREVFPSSFVLFLVSFVFIEILLEFPIFWDSELQNPSLLFIGRLSERRTIELLASREITWSQV